MDTTITLDERHFKVAKAKARKLGTTPEAYIHSLIDAAEMTFDEILAPVRAAFRESGTSEEELDEVVAAARKAIHRKNRRGPRK